MFIPFGFDIGALYLFYGTYKVPFHRTTPYTLSLVGSVLNNITIKPIMITKGGTSRSIKAKLSILFSTVSINDIIKEQIKKVIVMAVTTTHK